MLLLALLVCLPAGEPGFGGAPAAGGADFPTSPDAPVDDDPEQAALRAKLEGALHAQPDTPSPPAAMPKRSKLEEEVLKAKLDPTLPLLALRIEVARAEMELEDLTNALKRPEVVRAAEAKVAAIHRVSDLVERIALARLQRCTRALGQELTVKNYRMTAGGPILLSVREMVEQLPFGDPEGCERITLIDEVTVVKVRRLFAVRDELQGRSFGYREVAERKALEQEAAVLASELEQQAVAAGAAANQRP